MSVRTSYSMKNWFLSAAHHQLPVSCRPGVGAREYEQGPHGADTRCQYLKYILLQIDPLSQDAECAVCRRYLWAGLYWVSPGCK
jgi:hypothetical protein